MPALLIWRTVPDQHLCDPTEIRRLTCTGSERDALGGLYEAVAGWRLSNERRTNISGVCSCIHLSAEVRQLAVENLPLEPPYRQLVVVSLCYIDDAGPSEGPGAVLERCVDVASASNRSLLGQFRHAIPSLG